MCNSLQLLLSFHASSSVASSALSMRNVGLYYESLVLSSSTEKKESPAEMLQINIHWHICFVLTLLPKMLKIQTDWMGRRRKGREGGCLWPTPVRAVCSVHYRGRQAEEWGNKLAEGAPSSQNKLLSSCGRGIYVIS